MLISASDIEKLNSSKEYTMRPETAKNSDNHIFQYINISAPMSRPTWKHLFYYQLISIASNVHALFGMAVKTSNESYSMAMLL